jgi:hypothetical protein
MRTFLLIVALHGLILGFALLMAGWATLMRADDEEEAQIKKDCEEARRKGWLEEWAWYNRYRREFGGTDRISKNWSKRPDARKLLYFGAGSLAIAGLFRLAMEAFN